MIKVELHSHTADDPLDDIPHSACQLIDRAAQLGYGALAITLHEKQLDLRQYRDYAEQRGVTLISGVERTIEGKHVLLLNFSSATERVRTFTEVARLRDAEPGLVIAPHPYFPHPACLGGLLDRYADLFDAVEYNAMFTASLNFNRRAERWAAAHHKPIVGNGDVHRLYQLGTTYSLVDGEGNAEAICEAIRRGRVRTEASPLSTLTAATVIANLFGSELRARIRGAHYPAGEYSSADT